MNFIEHEHVPFDMPSFANELPIFSQHTKKTSVWAFFSNRNAILVKFCQDSVYKSHFNGAETLQPTSYVLTIVRARIKVEPEL